MSFTLSFPFVATSFTLSFPFSVKDSAISLPFSLAVSVIPVSLFFILSNRSNLRPLPDTTFLRALAPASIAPPVKSLTIPAITFLNDDAFSSPPLIESANFIIREIG